MKNYKFTINGNKYSVDVADVEENNVTVEVNGTSYNVELDMEVPAAKPKSVVTPVVAATPKAAPAPAAPVAPAPAAPTAGAVIKSPLPGRVLDVFVKEGDTVKQGQHLILLEAMKMENNIDSDKAGTVKEVRVRRDDSVMEGDILLVIG